MAVVSAMSPSSEKFDFPVGRSECQVVSPSPPARPIAAPFVADPELPLSSSPTRFLPRKRKTEAEQTDISQACDGLRAFDVHTKATANFSKHRDGLLLRPHHTLSASDQRVDKLNESHRLKRSQWREWVDDAGESNGARSSSPVVEAYETFPQEQPVRYGSQPPPTLPASVAHRSGSNRRQKGDDQPALRRSTSAIAALMSRKALPQLVARAERSSFHLMDQPLAHKRAIATPQSFLRFTSLAEISSTVTSTATDLRNGSFDSLVPLETQAGIDPAATVSATMCHHSQQEGNSRLSTLVNMAIAAEDQRSHRDLSPHDGSQSLCQLSPLHQMESPTPAFFPLHSASVGAGIADQASSYPLVSESSSEDEDEIQDSAVLRSTLHIHQRLQVLADRPASQSEVFDLSPLCGGSSDSPHSEDDSDDADYIPRRTMTETARDLGSLRRTRFSSRPVTVIDSPPTCAAEKGLCTPSERSPQNRAAPLIEEAAKDLSSSDKCLTLVSSRAQRAIRRAQGVPAATRALTDRAARSRKTSLKAETDGTGMDGNSESLSGVGKIKELPKARVTVSASTIRLLSPADPHGAATATATSPDSDGLRPMPDGVVARPDLFSDFYRLFRVPCHLNDGLRDRVFSGPFPQTQSVAEAQRRSAVKPRSAVINDEVEPLNLYQPRFTRGVGPKKEGLCPICFEDGGVQSWHKMKVSAYNYHLQIQHGISTETGLPMAPPVQFRETQRRSHGPHERSTMLQGLCHACNKWIDLQSVKQVAVKVPELYFRKHAIHCHKKRPMAGIGNPFVQDDFYHAVFAALMAQE